MAARFYQHFSTDLGMSRRHFLKHVSAGAAWAGSATHFFTTLQAEAAELKKNQKSVILLWMGGGPSTIDIWDLNHKDNEKQLYTVIVSRGTNTAEVLLTQDFTKPGRYVLQIPVVPPEAMNLVVGMINEHGQYFEDIVFVSVSTRFYVWIKYLIVAPVILFVTPLLLMRGSDK